MVWGFHKNYHQNISRSNFTKKWVLAVTLKTPSICYLDDISLVLSKKNFTPTRTVITMTAHVTAAITCFRLTRDFFASLEFPSASTCIRWSQNFPWLQVRIKIKDRNVLLKMSSRPIMIIYSIFMCFFKDSFSRREQSHLLKLAWQPYVSRVSGFQGFNGGRRIRQAAMTATADIP